MFRLKLQRLPLVWIGVFLALAVGVVGVCTLALSAGIMIGGPALFAQRPAPTVIVVTTTPTPAILPPPVVSTPLAAPLSSPSRLKGVAEDIPIPETIESGTFVGHPQHFSFLTDLSYPDSLAFYQQKLEEQGWVRVEYGTKIGRAEAELHYEKDGRRLIVRIAGVSYVGTVVEVQVLV